MLKIVASRFSFAALFFFQTDMQWEWEGREETNETCHLTLHAMPDKESKGKNNYLKHMRGHLTLREAQHLVPKENQIWSF